MRDVGRKCAALVALLAMVSLERLREAEEGARAGEAATVALRLLKGCRTFLGGICLPLDGGLFGTWARPDCAWLVTALRWQAHWVVERCGSACGCLHNDPPFDDFGLCCRPVYMRWWH